MDKKKEKESTKVEQKGNKEVNKIENQQEITEKKRKKKKIICIIASITLLILAILIFLFFFLKFKVTFKYNNGEDDKVITVKLFRKISKNNVNEDVTNPGKTFVGYFETYQLSNEQIENIKNDEKLLKTICKKEFKINAERNKCVANDKFDFENKRITRKTTIEALWSDIDFSIDPTEKSIYVDDIFKITATINGTDNKTVTWISNDNNIAVVDGDGNVKGVKKGTTTIVAESNGIKRECIVTVETKPVKPPKDEGKVSLTANDQCMIGTSSVTAKAKISNAMDNTLTWSYPRCYAHEVNESDNSVKLYRTMVCSDDEEMKPVLSVKLNNGSSDSLTFTYEPKLDVKVYNNGTQIFEESNAYYGNNIRIVTNVNAIFSGKYFKKVDDRTIEIDSASSPIITITTTCGQSKTIKINAIIN